MPPTLTQYLSKNYTFFKNTYVDTVDATHARYLTLSNYRPGGNEDGYSAEGVYLGMLLGLIMSDETFFNQFWNYGRQKLYKQGRTDNLPIFSWVEYQSDGFTPDGSAGDGDTWIIWALLKGYEKWGNPQHLQDSLDVAGTILNYSLVKLPNGRRCISSVPPSYFTSNPQIYSPSGDFGSSGELIFPNYQCTAFYYTIAKYDTANRATWLKAVDDFHWLMNTCDKVPSLAVTIGFDAGHQKGYEMPPERFYLFRLPQHGPAAVDNPYFSDDTVMFNQGDSNHYAASTDRLWLPSMWLAGCEGHGPSMAWLSDLRHYNVFQNHYESKSGQMPWTWSGTGTSTTGHKSFNSMARQMLWNLLLGRVSKANTLKASIDALWYDIGGGGGYWHDTAVFGAPTISATGANDTQPLHQAMTMLWIYVSQMIINNQRLAYIPSTFVGGRSYVDFRVGGNIIRLSTDHEHVVSPAVGEAVCAFIDREG